MRYLILAGLVVLASCAHQNVTLKPAGSRHAFGGHADFNNLGPHDFRVHVHHHLYTGEATLTPTDATQAGGEGSVSLRPAHGPTIDCRFHYNRDVKTATGQCAGADNYEMTISPPR